MWILELRVTFKKHILKEVKDKKLRSKLAINSIDRNNCTRKLKFPK